MWYYYASITLCTYGVKEAGKHRSTAALGSGVSNRFLQMFKAWTWADIIPGYVVTLWIKTRQ